MQKGTIVPTTRLGVVGPPIYLSVCRLRSYVLYGLSQECKAPKGNVQGFITNVWRRLFTMAFEDCFWEGEALFGCIAAMHKFIRGMPKSPAANLMH